MSYESIISLILLILLGGSLVFSMFWLVRQIELDVKNLKESK